MQNRLNKWWYRMGPVIDALTPVLAVLAALLVGALMLLALGANPLEAYAALIKGAFGTRNAIAETIVKATPLLLVGLGICIAFRSGVINVGGEGQMIMGAIAAAVTALLLPGLPTWAALPLSLALGFVAGAIWGVIAGLLKAQFNVNEILSTIMMNQIAVLLLSYLLRGPIQDPTIETLQTSRFTPFYNIPTLIPQTRLHIGTLLAVILAVLVYIFLWRTTLGYRIRAVGQNQHASRYAGINVKRTMALSLALSGAFAGLAGAMQVLVQHQLVTDGTPVGFTTNAGFNGIVAALFGQLHPIGTIPAAFFFGALLYGASALQTTSQVPSALITALNGLIIIFVVSSELWRRQRTRRRALAQAVAPTESDDAASPQPEAIYEH